jgi:hypothetical protein
VSGIFFLVTKKWVIKTLKPYHMTKVKNIGIESLETSEKRANKMSKYVFSFFYFTCMTLYGYYTTKDEKWMPWFLGGPAKDFTLMQENQPFTPTSAGCITFAML